MATNTDLAQRSSSTDVDATFDDLMQRMVRWPFDLLRRNGEEQSLAWAPSIEMQTRDDNLIVRAELPGIDPEDDVEVFVQNGVLVIRGERRREQRDRNDRYYRSEVYYGSFLRTVTLPQGARTDDISAKYEDGVLEITVPLESKDTSGKRVEITSGQQNGGKRRRRSSAEDSTDTQSESGADNGRSEQSTSKRR
jgi:HSP20 family protein